MTKPLRNTEVELTFPLRNPEQLNRTLETLAKPDKVRQHQKDVYFVPAHRDFLHEKPITEWLRIRETDKGASVNYKHWHNKGNAQAVSCDEYETPVSDVKQLYEIFKRLDIQPIVTVEKTRSTWMYRDVEIAVDEVVGLGFYIELEVKGAFGSIEKAKSHLYAVLKEMKAEIGEQDFRGYPHLLLEKQGIL